MGLSSFFKSENMTTERAAGGRSVDPVQQFIKTLDEQRKKPVGGTKSSNWAKKRSDGKISVVPKYAGLTVELIGDDGKAFTLITDSEDGRDALFEGLKKAAEAGELDDAIKKAKEKASKSGKGK